MTDIVDFLRNRLVEDEESVVTADCRCESEGHKRPDCPDRILDEVNVKRAAIHDYVRLRQEYLDKEAEVNEWDDSTEGFINLTELETACGTLLSILKGWAAVWADHPYYGSIRQLKVQ